MEPLQFVYKNSTICYYRFGSGPKPAICFHGYGEDASIFEFLSNYAGNQLTFYCIDLPFHGKTDWKDELTFTESDLLQIVEIIIGEGNLSEGVRRPSDKPQTSNFPQGPVGKLSVIGFSLGGRIALSLYQAMPEKIEKIILLAPDGLKVNFWYWLSTRTWLGNKFFAFTMKHPHWFFWFIKLLNRLKMINASIFKFVSYYVNDARARHFLYTRWTTLRKLKPNLSRIKNHVRSTKTLVRLLYGMHDRIILPGAGEKFRKGIEEECTITLIHSGHQVLHEKHIEEILPALLN